MTTSQVAPGTPCVICGVVERDPLLLSSCFDCNGAFHLNPRSDTDGVDCGDATLGSEYAGVYYYCNRCLAIREELDAPPGVDVEWARQQAYGNRPSPAAPVAPPAPAAPRSDSATRTRRRYRRVDRDQP